MVPSSQQNQIINNCFTPSSVHLCIANLFSLFLQSGEWQMRLSELDTKGRENVQQRHRSARNSRHPCLHAIPMQMTLSPLSILLRLVKRKKRKQIQPLRKTFFFGRRRRLHGEVKNGRKCISSLRPLLMHLSHFQPIYEDENGTRHRSTLFEGLFLLE